MFRTNRGKLSCKIHSNEGQHSLHGWGNYMCRYCPKIKLLEDTTSLQSIENNEKKKIRFQKYGQYQYTYIYIYCILFLYLIISILL